MNNVFKMCTTHVIQQVRLFCQKIKSHISLKMNEETNFCSGEIVAFNLHVILTAGHFYSIKLTHYTQYKQ